VRLNGFVELELPPAPATWRLKLLRFGCLAAWLVAFGLGVGAMLIPSQDRFPVGFFALLTTVIAAVALSVVFDRLRELRDREYWTEARIRDRHYPIWWMAFGAARRLGRRP